MTFILSAVVPLFALILTGYLCGRRRLLGAGATDCLNRFVVFLALPAVLFQATATIPGSQFGHPGFIAAFVLSTAITFAISFVPFGRRRPPLADSSVEGLDAAFPNIGFIGVPLCAALFGNDGVLASIIALLIVGCILFAIAILLIEIDLQPDRRLSRKIARIVASLLRNPLILAPLGGLVVNLIHLPLPAILLRYTTVLGAASAPCALVTVGLFLAESGTFGGGATVARLLGLKLVLQPALTWVLAFEILLTPYPWAQAAVLLSALPIGTGPFMLAKLYDREAVVTSRVILLSTVLSIVTIPLLVALMSR